MRCSVCELEPARLTAINETLRDPAVSLSELACTSGIARSTLARHARHLTQNADPIVPHKLAEAETVLTKSEVLRRAEFLWGQAVKGLEASQVPITFTKGDGSKIDIQAGDLKAQAAMLRESRHLLEAAADWSGHPRRIVGNEPGCLVQLIVPASVRGAPEPEAVEIALPRRLR
jgi:hypothetical protein